MRKFKLSGLALSWQYDALGRLAMVSGDGNSVAYSWRGDGRRLAGLTWRRNDADLLPVAFTYDRWENIAEIGFGLPGQVRELAYEYDAGGRRTGITLANGDRWEYQYDSYGQVVQGRKFDDGGVPYAPQQHRYLYDDIGNRKNVHSGAGARPLWYTGNALNQYVNWGSDSFIPIAGKASADAKVTVKATASGVSRTYEPVRDGEDFAIDIPVDVSRGAVVTDLEVNAVRFDEQQDIDLYRRLSGRYTVTPNAANVMTYDADGNLLAYDGWTLTWNGENRLVQIEKGSHRETYDYDYMGRRFVKKVYSKENDVWSLAGEEVFVYDGYKQIAAYAGASRTLARTYAWDAAGLDTPLWTTDATGSCFYVADANKNIRMLFDGNGTAVAEYDYAPFGQVTATGDYAAVNPYRFSSEFHDDGTGLVYYNYRYYSPVLGRWTSRDPIGEEGGGNLYVLVYNNPVHHIDVFGLFQWPHRGYCAGKSYNRFTSCCCCNGEKVRNGGSECKKQDCNDYRDTGIKQCFILPIINSSKYGHAYITIDGKSWGFWPGKNPFGGIGLIGRDPYEGKGICIPVVISPCSHNREKFRSSVRNFIENARKNQNLRYFYPIYACNWFVKKAIEAGIYGSEGCTSGD